MSDTTSVEFDQPSTPSTVISRWGKETMKSSIVPGIGLAIPYLIIATTTMVGTVTGLGTNDFQEVVTLGGPAMFFTLMSGVGAVRVKTAPAREAKKLHRKALRAARRYRVEHKFQQALDAGMHYKDFASGYYSIWDDLHEQKKRLNDQQQQLEADIDRHRLASEKSSAWGNDEEQEWLHPWARTTGTDLTTGTDISTSQRSDLPSASQPKLSRQE